MMAVLILGAFSVLLSGGVFWAAAPLLHPAGAGVANNIRDAGLDTALCRGSTIYY